MKQVLAIAWIALLLACAPVMARPSMPSWPAMNGPWFSVWVLVRAEVGTDLSRTYMSKDACRARLLASLSRRISP